MNAQPSDTPGVGIVQLKTATIPLPEGGLKLEKGGVLGELTVAYETYGELSEQRDNVVFICHSLTHDAHVAGRNDASDEKPGWWDDMVGPGRCIDTNYYHVVCANILGGCGGTTGPQTTNPETGKPYGSTFPAITAGDIIEVHKLLLDSLGITRLAAVIGGSFGGMQVLEWSIRYPDMVDRCVCVAAAACLSAQALAFDLVARDAILSDPNWAGGDYYDADAGPDWGLSHARKIGHITYLSPEIMQAKFGREKAETDGDDSHGHLFEVEAYLNYQGRRLVERFDANSYLRITHAMDSFDLAERFGSLEDAFRDVKSKFLIIALSSDWLFPPEQSTELAAALLRTGKAVSYCRLEAPHGHDAFLIDIDHLAETVRAFLPWVGNSRRAASPERAPEEHRRFRIIANSVRPQARVLDLGCGNGDLLTLLTKEKQTSGLGVDIDLDNLVRAIDEGHDVFQGDLDEGLSAIPDASYDYAILSSTLQEVRRPRKVLGEVLRVAKRGIVTFPNFANWRNRLSVAFRGRMPKSEALPHEWYDTPNIHLTTRNDFVDLCRREGIEILDMVCIPGKCPLSKLLVMLKWCNVGAERVVATIARPGTGTAEPSPCRSLD